MGPQPWSSSPFPDCLVNGVATLQCFEIIFANILRSIIPLAGLAAFVIILIGGFQYITAAGDPKQLQQAQGMITGAIIGIAVAAGIWFLFQLIYVLTGVYPLQFEIPS